MPKNFSYSEFIKREHDQKVEHFVRYCEATDRPPTSKDAMEIFGYGAKAVAPIVADAIMALDILKTSTGDQS